MRSVLTPYVERRLTANSAASPALQYAWLTSWYLAAGVDTIRAAVKCFNVVKDAGLSSFQWQLCIETAKARPDNPNTTITLLGTQQANAGEYKTGSLTVSGSTAGAMWFRLGVA